MFSCLSCGISFECLQSAVKLYSVSCEKQFYGRALCSPVSTLFTTWVAFNPIRILTRFIYKSLEYTRHHNGYYLTSIPNALLYTVLQFDIDFLLFVVCRRSTFFSRWKTKNYSLTRSNRTRSNTTRIISNLDILTYTSLLNRSCSYVCHTFC